MAYNNSDLFDNFNNRSGRGGTYVPGQGTQGRSGTSVPGQGTQSQGRGGTDVPGQGPRDRSKGGTDVPGQGGGRPSDYIAPPDEENISELLRFLYRTRSWNADQEQFRARVADMFRKGDTLTGFSGMVYTIDGSPVFGGESAVLPCRDNRAQRFAAKIYYDLERNKAINTIMPLREKIIELTRSREAEGFLLPITDVGFAVLEPGMNNYVEFQPFCKEGDVSDDGAFSVAQLKPLIHSMNEALHLIHTKGFIHRDVKPENIYKSDTGDYLLGDFGVVSMSIENRRVTQTITGSPDYMAPEMLLGAPRGNNKQRYYISNAIDYYALGLTLASLFVGRYIFEGIIDRIPYILRSELPIPPDRTDPEKGQFVSLVTGLCQYDETRRFGYEEVRKWLRDPNSVIAPVISTDVWTSPFVFSGGRRVTTPEDFFKAATENEASWDSAVKMLYQGLFFDHFKKVDQSLASCAKDLVEVQYPHGNTDTSHEGDTALFHFLRVLYPMGEFVWRAKKYSSLSEIGDAAQKKENSDIIAGFLSDRLLSVWLDNSEGLIGADTATRQLIHEIEDLGQPKKFSQIAVAWLGYAFGRGKSCLWGQKSIASVKDFLEAATASPQFFYGGGGTMDLLKYRNAQNINLFGLICSFGYKEHLMKLLTGVKKDDAARSCSLMFVFLERLADKNASLAERVRRSYLVYGPLGYLGYARMLVNKGIYTGTTAEDRKILSEVKQYDYDRLISLPIDDENAELAKLLKPVTYIKDHLQNNPYLAEIGIFRGKTMRCSQADGLFCCTFLGAEVPMGFSKMVS